MSEQSIPAPVEYKDIPGYPGYRAGSDGTVWSCCRPGSPSRDGEWKKLKPGMNRAMGRWQYCLKREDGARPTRRAANLIALAFHGPRPEGLEIRHLDGDPTNDRPDNLAYGTKGENAADRVIHGIAHRAGRGESNPRTTLTDAKVREIHRLRAEGWSQPSIAKRFGVNNATVCRILAGYTWSHVKEEIEMKGAPKESEIQKACFQYLAVVRRWHVWRNNTGAVPVGQRFVRFGQIGSSDLLAVIPPTGRLLACEVKRPGCKATEVQASWLASVRGAGALAIIVTGIDDLRRQLAEAGYPE